MTHHNRLHTVVEDYFDSWSSNMAYILGFVMGDGCVPKRGYSLQVGLSAKDESVLDFIRSEICPTARFYETTIKGKLYFRLSINSKNLVCSLAKLGVVSNKTGRECIVEQIPKSFVGDYLRGIFDADGWVTLRRNSIESGIVSASKFYITQLRKMGGNIGTVNRYLKKGKTKIGNKYKPVYYWEMYKQDTLIFRDLIYASGGFSLDRKRQKMYSQFYIPSKRRWTEGQLDFLRQNYVRWQDGCLQHISEHTGKSYKAVSKKVWELQLCQKSVSYATK